MDAGRWVRHQLAQPLTEDSHHGRLPLTMGQRIAVIVIAALAAWIVMGAGVVAAVLLAHWATGGLHGMVHGQP